MTPTSFFLDPNVVYMILIATLWAVVTAIHLPGSGIIEVIALAGLIGVIIILGQLPTQWVWVILTMLGVLMFLVLPLVDTRLYLVGLAGLALQGVGGWFMFDGISVSPVIIALSLTLGILYYAFALRPVLKTQSAKGEMLEDQSLVGQIGYVQTAINPVGTVYVHGESWTARRGDDEKDPIEAGIEIIVRDRDELTLFVEPIKRKREGA